MSINLKNITIDYGNFLAVNNLNISIETGQLVSLLGPSGCGKTTALNAIAGLINTTKGQILFDGVDVTDKTSQKRNIGLVFQSYALYPHMTVFKNIAYPLYYSKTFKEELYLDNLKFKSLLRSIKNTGGNKIVLEKQKQFISSYRQFLKNTVSKINKMETDFLDLHKGTISSYINELFKPYNDSEIVQNHLTSYLYDKLKIEFLGIKSRIDKFFANEYKNINLKQLDIRFIETVKYYSTINLKNIKKDKGHLKNLVVTGVKNKKLIQKEEKTVSKDLNIFKSTADSLYNTYKDATDNVNKKFIEDMIKPLEQQIQEYFTELKEKTFLQELFDDSNQFINSKSNKYPKNKSELETFIDHLISNGYSNLEIKEKVDTQLDEQEYKKNIYSFKRKVKELVFETSEKVEIQNQLNKKPYELSGGQQQRVAIARAIVKKPKILLMDEPLSNLDAKLRLSTREWIKRFQQNVGITTVFVTHDQEEALSISDSVFIMEKGVLQQSGTPIEIYRDPINIFVANFIGTPNMNFIKTKLEDKKIILPNEKKITFKNSDYNDEITLGIRPEHIDLFQKDGQQHLATGEVILVEQLGKTNHIKIKVNNNLEIQTIIDPIDWLKIENHKLVELYFDPKNIFIFGSNGLRIRED